MFLIYLLYSTTKTPQDLSALSSKNACLTNLSNDLEIQEEWREISFYLKEGTWTLPTGDHPVIEDPKVLVDILNQVNKEYMKSQENPNQYIKGKKASHLVFKKEGYYFKFLNLKTRQTDGQEVSDEAPANEFIGRSLYRFFDMTHLNAPINLFTLKISEETTLGVQVSPDLGDTRLSDCKQGAVHIRVKNYAKRLYFGC